jgi:hypothetical protein
VKGVPSGLPPYGSHPTRTSVSKEFAKLLPLIAEAKTTSNYSCFEGSRLLTHRIASSTISVFRACRLRPEVGQCVLHGNRTRNRYDGPGPVVLGRSRPKLSASRHLCPFRLCVFWGCDA